MNFTIKTAFVDEIFLALIPTTRILIRGVVLWQAYLDRMTCKCFAVDLVRGHFIAVILH